MVGFKSCVGCGLLMAWLQVWGLSVDALAQFPNFAQNDAPDEAFLLAPRPLTRLLREGEIAFKEERWADGIISLNTAWQGC